MTEKKDIQEYSIEELKRLYKRYDLYAVTEYLRFYRTSAKTASRIKENEPLEMFSTRIERGEQAQPFWNNLKIGTIDNYLHPDYCTLLENARRKLDYERTTLKIANSCLFYVADGYKEIVEYHKNIDRLDKEGKLFNYVRVYPPIEEYFETLHENDDFDRAYQRATRLEMLEFVWYTLQWCDAATLKKLTKYADKRFEIQEAHRPVEKICIKQFRCRDEELVDTFMSRQECIEKTGINKVSLSQALSSYNENIADKTKWRKWKGKDKEYYWFIVSHNMPENVTNYEKNLNYIYK